jgi:hypothetical protein
MRRFKKFEIQIFRNTVCHTTALKGLPGGQCAKHPRKIRTESFEVINLHRRLEAHCGFSSFPIFDLSNCQLVPRPEAPSGLGCSFRILKHVSIVVLNRVCGMHGFSSPLDQKSMKRACFTGSSSSQTASETRSFVVPPQAQNHIPYIGPTGLGRHIAVLFLDVPSLKAVRPHAPPSQVPTPLASLRRPSGDHDEKTGAFIGQSRHIEPLDLACDALSTAGAERPGNDLRPEHSRFARGVWRVG